MSYTTTTTDPTEWSGTNNRCKKPFCGVELDMNDYDDICINCHNQVEPEEEEEPSPERKELLNRFMQFPTLEKK